ncbi:hypothetical protein [Echinicola rosea]|uniref:DUF4625 domain-containing protein n=1 Tax=Echinicola rosea TaxID=1807691 RepID=A0ABQ1V1Y3_9BACT|nr:hypothetical protein [Echinicola rosea]GGF34489.1 hypothetical protein GCM10011339_23450 [Echinicola rosea]
MKKILLLCFVAVMGFGCKDYDIAPEQISLSIFGEEFKNGDTMNIMAIIEEKEPNQKWEYEIYIEGNTILTGETEKGTLNRVIETEYVVDLEPGPYQVTFSVQSKKGKQSKVEGFWVRE